MTPSETLGQKLRNPMIDVLAQRAIQTGSGTPAPGPASSVPQTDMHIQVTHALPGEVPPLGTPQETPQNPAPPQARALQTSAPVKPLAKINPVQPNENEVAAQGRYNHLVGTKPGWENIHNPVLRTLAGIGNAVGGGLFPNIAQYIPGTTLHHGVETGEAARQLKQEQANRKDTAKEEQEAALATEELNKGSDTKSPTNEIELFLRDPAQFAKYREMVQRAQATGKPEFIKDGQGNIIGMLDGKGMPHSASDPALDPQARAIMESAKPKEPSLPEGERPLPNAENLNKALEARFQVLNPGKPLPPQFQIPPNATQKDYDRVDKALEAVERATGTKEQQNQTNEMRRQTMAIAASNRQQKTDTDTRKAAFKAYEPAMDSSERFNVMAKNYEDAVKNHDQQAMLSLLANHLGMTMGLQKGSRLTRDIIREAEQSRPWLQGMQAKFDKDGYLSGVNLTPMQMRQMVNLGRERFAEDVSKGRSEARYLGANDEGPERTPSKSTINHYIALANGDAKKAKELAAADGWTVK